MKEVELKFQVPATARVAVDAAVAGAAPPRRLRLQAVYFDTPGRTLAAAGLALRLRKEGRVWVQTLKGLLPDGSSMVRAEHNVPRAGGGTPDIDPGLHADTPVGLLLQRVLQGAESTLAPVMSTDIRRRARAVRVPGGAVELAFDVGSIEASACVPPRRLAVCELEIELKRGSPQAVVRTAQRWVARHGLWLDTRSKAELGHLLSRDDAMAEPCRAQPVLLSKTLTPAAALDDVLRSCLAQISVNASQIASGRHVPEHTHQLRVGLRRLRTALRFFDGRGLADAIDECTREALASDAAALFRQLGQARDRAAVAEPLADALTRALAAVGLPPDPPRLPDAEDEVDPTVLVRHPLAQRLMLNLLSRVHAAESLQGDGRTMQPLAEEGAATATAPQALPLSRRVAKRLNRWHRQVLADAQAFSTLDDDGRHRLRKRIKRLRYAAEFVAHLYAPGAVRPYLKALRALQEALGVVNDVAVGIALYTAAAPADTRALFALGWLAAQRERALAACQPALARFVKAERFWRGRHGASRKAGKSAQA